MASVVANQNSTSRWLSSELRQLQLPTSLDSMLRTSKASGREIYKSAIAQFFPHYDSAKKVLRKRNSDRYREPQQRFTKPQTGLYMTSAMYSTSQQQQSGVCSPS